MSAREITYTCPACTMLFFGPFVICHMCGYSKIEEARKRELTRIAEQIQDLMEDSEGLMASIKADNDRAEARESVWDAQDRLVDDAYSAWEGD